MTAAYRTAMPISLLIRPVNMRPENARDFRGFPQASASLFRAASSMKSSYLTGLSLLKSQALPEWLIELAAGSGARALATDRGKVDVGSSKEEVSLIWPVFGQNSSQCRLGELAAKK